MSLMFFFLNLIDISGIGTKNVLHHTKDALIKLGSRLSLSPILIFVVLLVLNFIVDYFSLLETRWILSRIKKVGVFRTITLTVIDYTCTTLLWVVSFYSLVLITNSFSTYFTSFFFYIFAFLSIVLRITGRLRDRIANALLSYSRMKKPRPLILLAIILGAISQRAIAIAKLLVHESIAMLTLHQWTITL